MSKNTGQRKHIMLRCPHCDQRYEAVIGNNPLVQDGLTITPVEKQPLESAAVDDATPFPSGHWMNRSERIISSIKNVWCRWFHDYGVKVRQTRNALYLKCKKCGCEEKA